MILFFESAAEGLMNNWSPAYLQSTGMGKDEALYMLTILSASLTVARLVLGGVLKHLSEGWVLGGSIVCAIVGVLLLGASPGIAGAAAGMVCIGAGFAAAFPVVLGIVGGLFPRLSGTAFGIALVIALTGNTIMNTALGAASGAWGIGIFPWYLLCTLAGLGVMLILALRSLARRRTV
jgi:fucose permease